MEAKDFSRRGFLAVAAGAGLLAEPALPLSSASAKDDREFLFADGLTYLNTGTLGPCRRETIAESLKFWEEFESLPVKFYGGWGAESVAERTRTVAARFLGCDVSEMIATNSTTNGMNAVAQGLRLKSGDRVLVTDQEHGGGLLCWKYLAKYEGVAVDTVAIPKGEVSAEEILDRIGKAVTKKTKVISVSHVFSSTGLRMPVARISALARSKGIICVVDGAQAAGAIRVNLKELGCHAYATSGHKWLMGPKGTGLLYISKDAQDVIRPMQFEESYKTYNDGNGVVNLACVLGLAKAIEYLESIGIDKIESHNLSLRNRLYEALGKIGKLKVVSPPPGPLAAPMVAALLPESVDRAAFVKMLVAKHELSIRATHKEFGFNGIRFCTHIFNTGNQVDFAVGVVSDELA